MGIKEQSRGKYIITYSKRHPITRVPYSLRRKANTQAEAKRALEALIILVNDHLTAAVIPSWEKLLKEYEIDMRNRNLKEHTIHSTLSCLNKHIDDNHLSQPCSQFQKKDILDILTKKMANRSDSHKQYVLKSFRGIFNYAMDRGYIERNPTPTFKFRPNNPIEAVLKESEVRLFLEQARLMNNPWYYIWAFAIYLGMRNGELYALTWDCIDADQQQVHVRRSWNSKDGFKTTKSKEDRLVGIPNALLPVINELRLIRVDEFVLPRLPKWSKGEQAKELRKFLSLIGLRGMRFHDLRATWATLLLNKGVEQVKIMKMAGWKEFDTMARYVRRAGVDITGASNVLNLHDHTKTNDNVIPLRM